MQKGRVSTMSDLNGTGQIRTCSGKEPEGYGDLFLFVPEMRQIVRICEGTGDNLLWEDREEGYVDYIYYEQYDLDTDTPETDGGQVMLYRMFRDQFQCTADCIPRILDMAYGKESIGYVILI